jgi:hypothetical protein
MSDELFVKIWMLVVWLSIFIFAFLEQPYWLTAAISVLVIKQLGRINTTLRNKQ